MASQSDVKRVFLLGRRLFILLYAVILEAFWINRRHRCYFWLARSLADSFLLLLDGELALSWRVLRDYVTVDDLIRLRLQAIAGDVHSTTTCLLSASHYASFGTTTNRLLLVQIPWVFNLILQI